MKNMIEKEKLHQVLLGLKKTPDLAIFNNNNGP